MAPIAFDDVVNDGFTRTISDEYSTTSDVEKGKKQFSSTESNTKFNGTKRKYSEFAGITATLGNTSETEKSENLHKGNETTFLTDTLNTREAASHDAANDLSSAEGEDGGAMDSDFEFQLHDLDRNVIEELDTWGLPTQKKQVFGGNQGTAAGLGLEELIARKRKRNQGSTDAKITNSDVVERSESSGDDSFTAGGARGAKKTSYEAVEDGENEETMPQDAFGMGANLEEDEKSSQDRQDDLEASSESDQGIADDMPEPDDGSGSAAEDSVDALEQAKRDSFFDQGDAYSTKRPAKPADSKSFQPFSLSRPILRGLTSAGFSTPTPIQKRAIPVALLGKDVVGGAVTGSGKTAAFVIPILERLLYRPKKVPTSRVAILTPTRELALQCFNVARKLASFTDIAFCQLVGGFSLREQENVLRTRPDVIIATPGRFIDHMRNSPSFIVETLEILVLDEADRMLEDGFADELNQILTTIPEKRQTMLFSATMTDSVDKLIRAGLKKPVRLLVDAQRQTVGTLLQEFVRLRPGREGLRLGHLTYLCKEVFTDRVIVFFRQKKEAHRVRVIFGLLGIKAAELHGSMSQEQRISAITSFTSHTATHLLATDLASRGLDIPNVSTVINYSAPQTYEIYLHRVGRTARAGRAGRSCTLAAEEDRKIVKAAVKAGRAQGAKIVSRVIEPELVDASQQQVDSLEHEVDDILREEKEERLLAQGEMHVRKGENLIEHEAEIKARARRTWFESEKEKLQAKKAGFVELNGVQGGGKAKAKGGKLSGKEKKALDDRRERVEGRMWKKGKDGGRKGGSVKVKGKRKEKKDRKRM